MQFSLSTFINILFPQTEDEKNITPCTPESFMKKMSYYQIDDVNVLSSFSDKAIRSAIHLVKFHKHNHAVILLSSLLHKYITEKHTGELIIIPVPLSKKRQRQRGHNQVTTIAEKAVSTHTHIYVRTNVLSRIKHTVAQTSLSRYKRMKNMRKVFDLTTQSSCIYNKHIILLDDVTTTGATLRQAKATLLPASPASITCVALAH